MSFLAFLISGFFIGLFARALKPGNDGMAGALVAGYIGQTLGFYQPGEPVGWIASILGAIFVLVIAHALFRKRSTF